MLLTLRTALTAAAVAMSLCSFPARADGLADLKAALARLSGTAAGKGQLEVTMWRRVGEGKEADESQVRASLVLEDSAHGLQVLFSRELLARIDAEQRASANDPKAKTPLLNAMIELQVNNLRPVIATAPAMARALEAARFKGERPQPWEGRPARLLSFELPLDRVPERQRRYVQNFSVGFDLWIAADGTPLASRLHQNISGRAFVVVSFESLSDEDRSYGVVGDRLVTLRSEVRTSTSGAGDKEDRKVTMAFQPRP